MADPERLTAQQREFIESMGVFFAHFGLARLVGRLVGLLMLTDRPLTLDDMAQTLLVSRAAVSTNIRIALHNAYVVRVGIPGDRRDYYAFSDAVWERRTQIIADASNATLAMAERGLSTLGPDDVSARERLDEMRDYCVFAIEEGHTMLAHWRERKRARDATKKPAGAATSLYVARDSAEDVDDDIKTDIDDDDSVAFTR